MFSSSQPSMPAALQDLAIDADVAELVDDEGEAPAIGGAQQMLDQAGLAGAEKSGDDGGGNLGGHAAPSFMQVLSFRVRGRPAARKKTRSASGRHGLVEAPGMVAKFARQRVVRNDAEADLVADQHDRRSSTGRAPRPSAAGRLADVAACRHQIGEPERQAIQQDSVVAGLGRSPRRYPAAPRRCASPRRGAAGDRRCARASPHRRAPPWRDRCAGRHSAASRSSAKRLLPERAPPRTKETVALP